MRFYVYFLGSVVFSTSDDAVASGYADMIGGYVVAGEF